MISNSGACLDLALRSICRHRGVRFASQRPARDGFRLAPKVFRAAVERIKPSLVTIEAFGGIGPSAGKTKRGSGISQPGDGPTTGLVISPDGYIVTSTFNFLRKPPDYHGDPARRLAESRQAARAATRRASCAF